MAKMVITVVVDADRATVRKVKNRIMLAAHKHIVSCSATFLEPDPKPDDAEQLDLFYEDCK